MCLSLNQLFGVVVKCSDWPGLKYPPGVGGVGSTLPKSQDERREGWFPKEYLRCSGWGRQPKSAPGKQPWGLQGLLSYSQALLGVYF